MIRVRLRPDQTRRLSQFWERQKAQIRDAADRSARDALLENFRGNGQIKNGSLPPLGGDVTGSLTSMLVQGIRGILIDPTLPTHRQVLSYDADSGVLKYSSHAASYWEPVTEWDGVNEPTFVFEGGSVVMDEAPD